MKKFVFGFLLLITAQAYSQLDAQGNIIFQDSRFKSILLFSNIDKNSDKQISPSECLNVTSLDLNNTGATKITSANELSYFVNLTSLDISSNSLTSLDVKKLTKLNTLNFRLNAIEKIDLSKNTALTTLICDGNNYLDSLNLKNLTSLQRLDIGTNYVMKEIDLTSNVNLKTLWAQNTDIINLDLTKNVNLTSVFFVTSELESISFPASTKLVSIDLSYNKLKTLDLTPLPNLTTVKIPVNLSLTEVCVLPSQNTTNWQKSSSTSWKTTCTLNTLDEINVEANKVGYYNSLDRTYLLNSTSSEWAVYQLNGIMVLKGTNQNRIPLNSLNNGLYVMVLRFGSEVITNKILVY